MFLTNSSSSACSPSSLTQAMASIVVLFLHANGVPAVPSLYAVESPYIPNSVGMCGLKKKLMITMNTVNPIIHSGFIWTVSLYSSKYLTRPAVLEGMPCFFFAMLSYLRLV